MNDMPENRSVLSEAPNALDGAIERLDADLERYEEDVRISNEIENNIRPFVPVRHGNRPKQGDG